MKKIKLPLGRILLNIMLICISFSFIIPLLLMVSISFSTEKDVLMNGYKLIPEHFTLHAYELALSNPRQMLQSYKVTFLFTILTVFGGMLVQSLMAYPLSRSNYFLKKFSVVFILITMLFSGGLIPSYIVTTKYLHLGNSFWVYILPCLFTGWNVILYKTYYQNLPAGLIEATKIDGAGEFLIYWKIILPLSKPILATMAFSALIGKWNDWNTTLVYIRDQDLYSLQYLLQRVLREAEYMKSMQGTAGEALMSHEMPTETMRYALAVLAAGPVLIIFPIFQKYFAKGLVVGSVKG